MAEVARAGDADHRAVYRSEHPLTRLRYVAPAGAPIGASDLVRWVLTLTTSGDVERQLEATVARLAGTAHCRVVSTGRAGLTLAVRALATLAQPTRREVIVPSYTCYSVAASIVKAGLTPRVIDIVPNTLDYNYEMLEGATFDSAVAIVATNLYGLPNDMPRLRRVAADNGIFVIDDAAQALGARVAGQPCGGAGHLGLYSFDKGKNVSAIDGGAVVTSDSRIADALDREVNSLPNSGMRTLTVSLVKLAAYVALLPSQLYWIPANIPQLGLGTTTFSTNYPLDRNSRALCALAQTMLRRLPGFTAERRRNAAGLAERLGRIPGLTFVRPATDSEPAYLRLPVLLPNRSMRDAAVAALTQAGIGASVSYPRSLADVPEVARCQKNAVAAGGREVADRILTLPTHPYLRSSDQQLTAEVLHRVTRDFSASAFGAVYES